MEFLVFCFGVFLDTFYAPMRMQRCHYVRDCCRSDLETVSLRRFHRNAAAAAAAVAPSLCSHRRRLALIALTRMSLHLKREIKQHLSASARAEPAPPPPSPSLHTCGPGEHEAGVPQFAWCRGVFLSARAASRLWHLPQQNVCPSRSFTAARFRH